MKPLYDRQEILRLIPQRPPVVEVDALHAADRTRAECSLTVRRENLFAEGEHLSEAGLLEHMAQSAAAQAGFLAVSRGERVPLGFIGAVDRATFLRRPRIGERIITTVERVEQVLDIALVRITSRIGAEEIAACRMKIFTEPDTEKA